MMKGLRKWAWMLPVTALLMVGEAYLLKGRNTRQSAPLPTRDVVLVAKSSDRDSSEAQQRSPATAFTQAPPAPLYPSGTPLLKAAKDAPSDSAAAMAEGPSRTEQVIDSLEHALHEMEQVVSDLMGQIHSARVQADTVRRRPRRPAPEPMTEVDRAVQEGRRTIDQRIRREGIDRHLDTLSRWLYHSPQLQEQIVDVNTAVYEYVESLRLSFSDADINQIRDALLDYWKSWSDRIAEKIHHMKEEDKNER